MPKILIIGGTGSLGHTLVNRYLPNNEIHIYSRDENKQWHMKNKYDSENLHFIIGDISDRERLRYILTRVQPTHIIIAAALKHIDICEYNTYESIKTNVNGIQNVIDCISTSPLENLDCVLFVSTDKACSPSNVYGMCKALSERIVIEKSLESSSTRFVVVRYGNVLSSRGSLLPKFHSIGRDLEKSQFTVTHKDMTRFFMDLEHSVDLIDYAMFNGKTGYTYIPNLPSYSIKDIAEIYSEIYNKPIVYTGIRPGEKMHEELINDIEMKRTTRDGKFFAVAPPYCTDVKGITDIEAYTSFSHLSHNKEILRKFIADAE
jgi:UDP-glucose 4-epimerase